MRFFVSLSFKCSILLAVFLVGLCCRVALTSHFYGKLYALPRAKAICSLVESSTADGLDRLVSTKIMKFKRRFDDDTRAPAFLLESFQSPKSLHVPKLSALPAGILASSGFTDPSLRPPC